MMAALCTAQGTSIVEETVYENPYASLPKSSGRWRSITVEGTKATIRALSFVLAVR